MNLPMMCRHCIKKMKEIGGRDGEAARKHSFEIRSKGEADKESGESLGGVSRHRRVTDVIEAIFMRA